MNRTDRVDGESVFNADVTSMLHSNNDIDGDNGSQSISNSQILPCQKSEKLELKVIKMKTLNCYACCKTFSEKEDLFDHLTEHKGTDEKIFRCPACLKMFQNNDLVISHMESVHKRVLVFPEEKKLPVIQRNSLQFYIIKRKEGGWQHQDLQEFKCKEIGNDQPQTHKTGNETKKELRENKIESEKRMKICDICGKKFNKCYLPDHKRRHFNAKNYVCEICGNSYCTYSEIKKHLRVHQKPDTCSICNKKVSSLRVHMNTCHNNEKYTCEICQKVFCKKKSYDIHTSAHINGRKYSCEICNVKFMAQQYLNKHLKNHSGFYTESCDICGRKVKSKFQLKRHMRIHTGEFPLKCEICGKGVDTQRLLDLHLISHSKVKDFECKVCSKKFSYIFNLRAHCKQVHGLDHEMIDEASAN